MFQSLTNAISGSGWAYAIILALAFLDSFFPVVPSETGVITGGVLAASGDLSIELVLVAAAAGAFAGDNFTYGLGKVFGDRLSRKLFRGKRAQRTLSWVQRTLEERGTTLIIPSPSSTASLTSDTSVNPCSCRAMVTSSGDSSFIVQMITGTSRFSGVRR